MQHLYSEFILFFSLNKLLKLLYILFNTRITPVHNYLPIYMFVYINYHRNHNTISITIIDGKISDVPLISKSTYITTCQGHA